MPPREKISYQPEWSIPDAEHSSKWTALQQRWVEGGHGRTMASEKGLDLMNYFRSDCYVTSPKYHIADTLQGYACRGFKINIQDVANKDLLTYLIGKEGWNMVCHKVEARFAGLPSECFIKVSLRFLVESYRSIQGTRIPECIVREMKILKKLNSENIARYVCHWETLGELGEYYLATEYCDSKWQEHGIYKPMSLFCYITQIIYPKVFSPINEFKDLIRRKKLAPDRYFPSKQVSAYKRWPVIAAIFKQLVELIKWLHEREIAHLDISLENLMIAGGELYKPKIKLIDFGVAQDFKDKKGMYDQCVGKNTYMAPEVRDAANTKNAYNAYAADIWTIGVCLWLMIFKQYPFHQTPQPMNQKELIGGETYLHDFMVKAEFLPMVTEEAFDVLNQIFKPASARITAGALHEKPYCK